MKGNWQGQHDQHNTYRSPNRKVNGRRFRSATDSKRYMSTSSRSLGYNGVPIGSLRCAVQRCNYRESEMWRSWHFSIILRIVFFFSTKIQTTVIYPIWLNVKIGLWSTCFQLICIKLLTYKQFRFWENRHFQIDRHHNLFRQVTKRRGKSWCDGTVCRKHTLQFSNSAEYRSVPIGIMVYVDVGTSILLARSALLPNNKKLHLGLRLRQNTK